MDPDPEGLGHHRPAGRADLRRISWIDFDHRAPSFFRFGVQLEYEVAPPLIRYVFGERSVEREAKIPHGTALTLDSVDKPVYSRIAVCIDFSSIDSLTIRSALSQGGKDAHYLFLHIVETAGAMVYGSDIEDRESSEDEMALKQYVMQIREKGYHVEMKVGFGNPKRRIPEASKAFNADLLVMGAHGHNLLKDLIFGTTVETGRHRVDIPVLIVREK